MHPGILVLCCSLMLSAVATARVASHGELASVTARADAHAAGIADARTYLAEIDEAIRLARAGQYGYLGRSEHRRLDAAQRRIHHLLEGRASALDLDAQERVGLYNAQELVRAVLRSDDKDRIVCRRETRTGSRIPTTECLTVAEREQRAEIARQSVHRMTRDMCFVSTSAEPLEAHDCAR